MKKILFVFNHPAPYKVRFLNELSKYCELHVIFERNNNSDRDSKFYFEHNYTFTLHQIKGTKISNENFISNGIVKHIKNNKYDQIIMNGYSTFAEMKAIRYLKKHKMSYALYINGGIIKHNEPKWKKNLKTKYISGADLYFSPDKNSNEYLKYYGADESKIHNYTYSTIYESEIVKDLPKKEEKIFVTCGQFIARKNFLSLIKVWPEDNNYKLLLIGDGPQRELLLDYIRDNQVCNIQIIHFQNRQHLFEIYKKAKAFVFSSNEDIYGHVINEAMSQGLPVISTPNVNASKKLIITAKNGYFLEKLDKETLKKYLDLSLELNPEDAIKTAKENTIEIMVSDHRKILSI